MHIWPTDSAEASAYLILLDWLRAHADDRELYAQVKRTLARRPWRDMNYYAEAKSAIIAQISASAGYPEVLER